TRIFNLIPSDRGRPLTDIAHHLDYPELPQDIQQVFGARQPLERRVNRRDGTAHYIVRALPYWTGSGKVEGAVLTFSDVTGLAQAEEQQRVLVAELNHRVKNMLTVIVSIATQTLKNSDDVGAARDAFLDRLHAMARAYELVSRDQWGDVSLVDVVRQEVEPYRTGRDDRIAIDGPAVSLQAETRVLARNDHPGAWNEFREIRFSIRNRRIARNLLGGRTAQQDQPRLGLDGARRPAGRQAAAARLRPDLDRARSQP